MNVSEYLALGAVHKGRKRNPPRPSELIPTEHAEQCAVVQYCDMKHIPIFAIPNGANKSIGQRMKFKAEGLRGGVPDLFIPVPRNGKSGMFVEMKRLKGSVTSTEQTIWIEWLGELGYHVVVAKGAQAAIDYINSYLA